MGDSLFRFLSIYHKKGIPIEALKILIRQVLEGLDYLHTKCRLIHTDIKPENILLTINKNQILQMHSEVINKISISGESGLPNNFISMCPTVHQKKSIGKRMNKNFHRISNQFIWNKDNQMSNECLNGI